MEYCVHGRHHFFCCAFEKTSPASFSPFAVFVVAVVVVVVVVVVLIVVGRAPSLKFKNWPLLFDSSLPFRVLFTRTDVIVRD